MTKPATKARRELEVEDWLRHWYRTRRFLHFWLAWTYQDKDGNPHPAYIPIADERIRIAATVEGWPDRFEALAGYIAQLKIDHALQILTTPPLDPDAIRIEKLGAVWPRKMAARPPVTDEVREARQHLDHGRKAWEAASTYPLALQSIAPLHAAIAPLTGYARKLEDSAQADRHLATDQMLAYADRISLGDHMRAFIKAEMADGDDARALRKTFDAAQVPRSPEAEAMANGDITQTPADAGRKKSA